MKNIGVPADSKDRPKATRQRASAKSRVLPMSGAPLTAVTIVRAVPAALPASSWDSWVNNLVEPTRDECAGELLDVQRPIASLTRRLDQARPAARRIRVAHEVVIEGREPRGAEAEATGFGELRNGVPAGVILGDQHDARLGRA